MLVVVDVRQGISEPQFTDEKKCGDEGAFHISPRLPEIEPPPAWVYVPAGSSLGPLIICVGDLGQGALSCLVITPVCPGDTVHAELAGARGRLTTRLTLGSGSTAHLGQAFRHPDPLLLHFYHPDHEHASRVNSGSELSTAAGTECPGMMGNV